MTTCATNALYYRCPRCRAEASLGDGMAEFLEELYEAAPELRHRAVEALQAGDMALLRQVDAQVGSVFIMAGVGFGFLPGVCWRWL